MSSRSSSPPPVRRLATLAALACLGGAAYAGPDAQRVPVTFAPTRALLVLIPGAEATQALADHRPAAIDAGSAAEARLLADCADGEPQRAASSRGFLLDVLTQGWRALLHPLAVGVRDALLKYSSVSSASVSADYYRGGSAETPAVIRSRISCLRFTRFASTDGASEEVALDFVASVRLDAARDAIRLRPLRLFISQAGARSVNRQYGVAIAVRADAVWRDEFTGHHGQVFEHTLVRESVDLRPGSYLKYYPADADSGSRVPIIPISYAVDRTRDFGRAQFEVSAAELGTPPAILTELAELLPDPDEKFSQLLIDAALAGANSR